MLNELWALRKSLEEAGKDIPQNHPRVTTPGPSSGEAIRVRLGADGGVAGIERVTRDEWPGLWVMRDGNQNYFPVCRLVLGDAGSESAKRNLPLLLRLKTKAKELADACHGHNELAGVAELMRRFLIASEDPARLQKGLRQSATLTEGTRYQFAFDVEDTVYRIAIRRAVEQALPIDQNKNASGGLQACAYTGATVGLQSGPFPKVMLPVLNEQFPLVSMFSAAPCNERYGLTDWTIVPVATAVALEMQDALTEIVRKAREDSTWRGIYNGHFDKSREQRDLLIVYVRGRPEVPAQIARIFGVGADIEDAQFEADASAVCDALDGIVRDEPSSKLAMFVLRKVSRGQAQVQLAEEFTAKAVIEGVRLWREGAANLPRITVFVPKRGLSSVRTPHPDRFALLTCKQWMASGIRWSPSQGASFGQALTVLLRRPGYQETAHVVLTLLVTRTWPLLTGLFGACLRLQPEQLARHGYAEKSCREALNVCGALGILLSALNHEKEDYMHDAPFLVGRLLALADVLHREHSRVARNAEPPPQMIGNALMARARDNPEAAVARLNDRLPLYKAWAEKSHDGLARWAVQRIQVTASELADTTLPSSTNDAERAQLILGYVSKLSDAEPPLAEEAADELTGGDND